MKLGRNKKQLLQQARRRPIGGRETASFASYYASKRSNISGSSAGAHEGRKTSSNTPSPWRFKQLFKGPSADNIAERFGKVLLAIVLVACVVSLLQIDTNPRVVMLNNNGGAYALHTTAVYEQAVANSLRGSLLNSNKITINTRGVVTHLKSKYPEIYDASVVLPLVGHRPTVYIELAQPVLMLQTASAKAAVDINGRALLVSTDNAPLGQQGLPTITDASAIPLHVGDVVLSSASVAFVKDVARQFAAQHVGIAKMVLPAGKEELDVYPQGTSYYVRFNLHETTSREQAGTYLATLRQLQRPGAAKPKHYIDVRLVGRVYIF